MWGTSSTQGVSNCKLRKYTSAFQASMVCCPDGALEINTIPLLFNLDKTSPLLLEAWHPEPMLTTWRCGITQCTEEEKCFCKSRGETTLDLGYFAKDFVASFVFFPYTISSSSLIRYKGFLYSLKSCVINSWLSPKWKSWWQGVNLFKANSPEVSRASPLTRSLDFPGKPMIILPELRDWHLTPRPLQLIPIPRMSLHSDPR